ncbi:hypothetical protein RN001_014987 [Aquatica leii]|uniref:Uncharacterized protein n=1 Tax=Aquatica leii TaxID=1421715 RepID=A0AAN7QC83_9COLE|nr:hypothetical protein RN001_014987 [Aquatica leii]
MGGEEQKQEKEKRKDAVVSQEEGDRDRIREEEVIEAIKNIKKRKAKIARDHLIAKMMNVHKPDRKRCRKTPESHHKFTVKYTVSSFRLQNVSCTIGYCIRTQNQINIAKAKSDKRRLKMELNVHEVRAKQFHKLMNETPANGLTFCFDLQQVQVLPKMPIQETFYAQQVALYIFLYCWKHFSKSHHL